MRRNRMRGHSRDKSDAAVIRQMVSRSRRAAGAARSNEQRPIIKTISAAMPRQPASRVRACTRVRSRLCHADKREREREIVPLVSKDPRSRPPACVLARKEIRGRSGRKGSGKIKRRHARAQESIARIHLDKPRRAINHPVINCVTRANRTRP